MNSTLDGETLTPVDPAEYRSFALSSGSLGALLLLSVAMVAVLAGAQPSLGDAVLLFCGGGLVGFVSGAAIGSVLLDHHQQRALRLSPAMCAIAPPAAALSVLIGSALVAVGLLDGITAL